MGGSRTILHVNETENSTLIIPPPTVKELIEEFKEDMNESKKIQENQTQVLKGIEQSFFIAEKRNKEIYEGYVEPIAWIILLAVVIIAYGLYKGKGKQPIHTSMAGAKSYIMSRVRGDKIEKPVGKISQTESAGEKLRKAFRRFYRGGSGQSNVGRPGDASISQDTPTNDRDETPKGKSKESRELRRDSNDVGGTKSEINKGSEEVIRDDEQTGEGITREERDFDELEEGDRED